MFKMSPLSSLKSTSKSECIKRFWVWLENVCFKLDAGIYKKKKKKLQKISIDSLSKEFPPKALLTVVMPVALL